MAFEQSESQGITIDQAVEQLRAQREDDAGKDIGSESEQHDDSERTVADVDEESQDEGGERDSDDDSDAETGKEDAEKSTTEESTDEEDPSIETLSDLAEALGQPLETVLSNLKTEITVDGEKKQVTLKEAFDGYNLTQASHARMKEVSDMRRQIDTEVAQHREDLTRQHEILGGIAQQLRQAFIGQVNSTELDRLKAENPGEYARIRLEIDDRNRAFDQLLQQGAASYQEMGQKQTKEQQEAAQKRLQAESSKLREAIPDWSDAESKRVSDYLAGAGYEPHEIATVADSRAIQIARKAMLYDQSQQQAKDLTKKVKQLPKLVKPAAKQSAIRADSEALQKARRLFAKTHSIEDAAALASLERQQRQRSSKK